MSGYEEWKNQLEELARLEELHGSVCEFRRLLFEQIQDLELNLEEYTNSEEIEIINNLKAARKEAAENLKEIDYELKKLES